MVNSYYGIYQAERGKSAAEIRVADAQLGGLAAELGQLGSAFAAPVPRGTPVAAQAAAGLVPGRIGCRMRAGPSPLTAVPRPQENGKRKYMAPVQWRDATVGGQDTTAAEPGSAVHGGSGAVLRRVPAGRGAGEGDVPGMPGQAGLPRQARWSAGSPGASGAASC